MREGIAIALCGIGGVLWLLGTSALLTKRSVLSKLHLLGVADTYGSLLIIAGLAVYATRGYHLLLLAAGSCVFWGTALSLVLAQQYQAHQLCQSDADDE